MKKFINFGMVLLFIMILVNATITMNVLAQVPNKLVRIFSSNQSQLNAANTHLYIYSLPLLLAFHQTIADDPTITLVRYQEKRKYFKLEILLPCIIQIIMLISFLYLVMCILAVGQGVFSFKLFSPMFKSFVMYLAFYTLLMNTYLLWINIGISKNVALVAMVLELLFINTGHGVIRNSLTLLLGGFYTQTNYAVISSLFFWYSLNYVLLMVNEILFKRKDIR